MNCCKSGQSFPLKGAKVVSCVCGGGGGVDKLKPLRITSEISTPALRFGCISAVKFVCALKSPCKEEEKTAERD